MKTVHHKFVFSVFPNDTVDIPATVTDLLKKEYDIKLSVCYRSKNRNTIRYSYIKMWQRPWISVDIVLLHRRQSWFIFLFCQVLQQHPYHPLFM